MTTINKDGYDLDGFNEGAGSNKDGYDKDGYNEYGTNPKIEELHAKKEQAKANGDMLVYKQALAELRAELNGYGAENRGKTADVRTGDVKSEHKKKAVDGIITQLQTRQMS